jgi:hypothetical protein
MKSPAAILPLSNAKKKHFSGQLHGMAGELPSAMGKRI